MSNIAKIAGVMLMLPGAALAQATGTGTVIEQAAEYRYQLDLAVNPAALAKFLPAGWEAAPAAQGPAKDCNLRLIFIDRITVTGPDNRATGSDRLAYLAAPVKQTGGTLTGQMIIAGISQNNPDAPGAFGTLVKASRVKAARSTTDENGTVTVTEDWDFAAASGEHMQLYVKYVRAPANRSTGETRFYNPADPSQVRIFRTETATDITRNVTTTPPDRVREFSFSAGGGRIAPLFDGSQKALSWDAQPSYQRAVVMP